MTILKTFKRIKSREGHRLDSYWCAGYTFQGIPHPEYGVVEEIISPMHSRYHLLEHCEESD